MVAARGLGLHTCPQAAFANYHVLIREQLGIPEDEVVICGMSLGTADAEAIENTLVTEREPVEGLHQLGVGRNWSRALRDNLQPRHPRCGALETGWQAGLFAAAPVVQLVQIW